VPIDSHRLGSATKSSLEEMKEEKNKNKNKNKTNTERLVDV
jgi:hypothetical protein